MRVAFLVSHFPIVSETFILDQITGLIDRGCEVTVFADEPAPSPAVHPEVAAYGLAGVTHFPPLPGALFSRPFAALRLAAANPRLRRTLFRSLNFPRYGARSASLRMFFETALCAKQPPFDIIHCHFGPNGLRGLALHDIGALRGKLVTSFYGYDVSEFLRRHTRNPYERLFSGADLLLAISAVMGRKLLELGCDANRVRVHRLGVHPDLFRSVPPAAVGRPIRILSIGRMMPKKGFEYALQAVAAVASAAPRIEYVIIGDGPLRPQLEQMIKDLGLQGVARLSGWQSRPEVVAAMGEADILLAPSVTASSGDQEGTPVVIMEAMASGLPVVSTIHAGIPEVVEDGVSGYLVPERDVPSLAGALKLLTGDFDLRQKMGQHGRSIIKDRHDIGKLNDELLKIYRELVSAAPQVIV